MKTFAFRTAAVGLLALLGAGASAWALPGDGKDEEKKVERRRIVMVGPDGKETVIDGHGPMVRRGYLGVGLTELTPELRAHFGAPEDAGVMVSSVEPGSPADKAGLQVGDILAQIDGKEVASSWDVRSRVRGFEEGQQVPLEIWRDRKVQTLTATASLRERPELDMGPLFMRRGEGEDGPIVLQLNKELGGMPESIELPAGAGPGEIRIRRSPRERQLEQRLQELEKRIAEMEKLLEKKGN